MISSKRFEILLRSFWLRSWVLSLIVSIGWSCPNLPAQVVAPADKSNAPKAKTASNSNDPADESLTSQEYLRLGLPAQDRNWSGDDLTKAQKVLASLAEQSYRKLPKYKSERSGEMFARLTSPDNLKLYSDRTLPLQTRLPSALKYYSANTDILKLYLAGFAKQQVRDSEIIELAGATLRSTAVMIQLADELLPTITKDDPNYQARMQGLDSMKQGLASIVSGGLQMLTETGGYRLTERTRLLGYLKETLPQIVPSLPPGSRSEMLLRLEKMQQDPALKDLQPGLGQLQSAVKASVER